MGKEDKLQAAMAMKFSQEKPEEEGLLWSTRNITLSQRDGQKQKAMGMKKGVADFIYFKDEIFCAIEVKFPGQEHDKNHIISQLKWGKRITKEGGHYFIARSLPAFWSLIEKEEGNPDVLDIDQIQELIDQSGSKVVF